MRLPRSVVLIAAFSKSGVGVGGRQGWACAAAASTTSAAAAITNFVRMGRSPWFCGLNWARNLGRKRIGLPLRGQVQEAADCDVCPVVGDAQSRRQLLA